MFWQTFLLSGGHVFNFDFVLGGFFRADDSDVGDTFGIGVFELFVEFGRSVWIEFGVDAGVAQRAGELESWRV